MFQKTIVSSIIATSVYLLASSPAFANGPICDGEEISVAGAVHTMPDPSNPLEEQVGKIEISQLNDQTFDPPLEGTIHGTIIRQSGALTTLHHEIETEGLTLQLNTWNDVAIGTPTRDICYVNIKEAITQLNSAPELSSSYNGTDITGVSALATGTLYNYNPDNNCNGPTDGGYFNNFTINGKLCLAQ